MSDSQVSLQSVYPERYSFTLLSVTPENYPELQEFLMQLKMRAHEFLNHENLNQFLRCIHEMYEHRSYDEFRNYCIVLQHQSSSSHENVETTEFTLTIQNKETQNPLSNSKIQENLVSVLICQLIPRKIGQLNTEWVNISWAIEREAFPDTLAFTQKSQFSAILEGIKSQFQGNIAYYFSKFPENKETKAILKSFKRSNSDFAFCYYPYDEKKTKTRGHLCQYRGNFGLFWNNESFDPLQTPPDLDERWKSANNLYSLFQKGEYNFQGKVAPYWKALIARKQYLHANYPEINEKLSNLKGFLRNNLNNSTFLADLDKKMKHVGVCLIIEEIPCPAALSLVNQFKLDLIINFIESIPSQGSLFNKLLDDSDFGQLSLKLFDNDHLITFFGKFLGFLTLQLDSGKKICLGYARGDYKQNTDTHSRQLMNGIVIPEMFRGFSLGKILTLSGMNHVLNKCDVFYEDATIFNEGTERMISILGFREFGILKNIMYGFNPHLKKITALNMSRKYWLNPNFVKEQRQLVHSLRKSTN